MRIPIPVLLCSSLLLVACGKAPQNSAAVPAASTTTGVPAPAASTAAAASTAPAAASTSEAATVSTVVAPDAATTTGPEAAGSVALAEGSVTDTAKDGGSRALKDGDHVYPGDSFVLGSDSYLDLDLEDEGRILLRPNTTFQIQSYHYDADAHDASGPTDANGQPLIKPVSTQPESAFFKLVKGGLRAVDGLIGKTNPQSYGVETPVATIGVRGTAFDVRYCGDDCADEADSGAKPDNGLYTSVTEGSIGVKNDSGETVMPAGHSSFVKSRKERVQALAAPPKALRHMDLPEKFKARAQKNRGNIRIRRQKRRKMIRQRRQAARGAGAGKPGAAGKENGKAVTPAERRQQRREERQKQRKGAELSQGKSGAEERGAKPETPAERRQQRREQRQEQPKGGAAPADAKSTTGGGGTREQMKEQRRQRREERQQQANPGAAASRDKEPKGDDEKCKGKKKRRKGKDKCGGD